MLTIVLPGFSPHNKEWADCVVKEVKLSHPLKAVYWEHWKSGGGIGVRKEMEKIKLLIENDQFNIIAKSVGTMITAKVLKEYGSRVKKIILCGIPTVSEKRMDLLKTSFEGFNFKNLLCIQNSRDPFIPFEKLEKEIKKVSCEIKIVEKKASNHDYPYFEDFEKFLK